MGKEIFPSIDPEAFLFGEMNDMYFLSKHPGAVRMRGAGESASYLRVAGPEHPRRNETCQHRPMFGECP